MKILELLTNFCSCRAVPAGLRFEFFRPSRTGGASVMKRRKRAPSGKRLMGLYNRRARQWGERYLRRNLWRIGAMYDADDIRQDAFAVYLRVYRRHPKCGEADLFRIYQRGMRGRVDNRSRQCFPNSYAYVAGQGKLVLNLDDLPVPPSSPSQADAGLDFWSEMAGRLPDELAAALKLIVSDFIGTGCIEQRRVQKLSGRLRIEPLGTALARAVGIDLSRDPLAELEVALEVQPEAEE